MAQYYFTIPDGLTLPTDGNKISLTTDCELHRDDSAVPNVLTVSTADGFNVFLADTPGTGTATAPDVTAPTISSSSPTDNATGVAIAVNPTITFDENIAFGTGNIILRDNDGGWADLEVFDVTSHIGGGAGTVSISGAVLTIEPTADLAIGTEYAIRIAATAIDDTSGNSFAGIADDTTISFTTVDVPAQMSAPTVTAIDDVSISVDRAAPPADGGSAITSYDLRWSTDESTWTTVTGITDPQTVGSLTASTLYYAQTRAVNAVGDGAWSTSGSDTTDAASGVEFTDDYTIKSDGYELTTDGSANWTRISGGVRISVTSGAAGLIGTNRNEFIEFTGAAVSDNQYFEFTLDEPGIFGEGGKTSATVYLRYVDANNFVQLQLYSGQIWNINKRIGGTWTYGYYSGPGPRTATSSGDVIRLEVNGDTTTFKINGSTVGTPKVDAQVGALTGGSITWDLTNLSALTTAPISISSISLGDL